MIKVSSGRIVADCIIVLILAGSIWALSRRGVDPYRRGFYCDDQTIRYPYKEETISPLQHILGTLAIIAIVSNLSGFVWRTTSASDISTALIAAVQLSKWTDSQTE